MKRNTTAQDVRVIWRAGYWRVLVDGLMRSAHDFRIDAEEAALRLAERTAIGRSRALVLVQRSMGAGAAFDAL